MFPYRSENGSRARTDMLDSAEDTRTKQVSKEQKGDNVDFPHAYEAILNPSKHVPYRIDFIPDSGCFCHITFKTEVLSPDQKYLNTSQMMGIKDTDLKLEVDGENRVCLDGTKSKKVHGGNGANRFHYTEGNNIRPREATTAVRKFEYWHRQLRTFLSKSFTSAAVANMPIHVILIMTAPVGPMGEADRWAEIVRQFGMITVARNKGLSMSLVVDLPRCEYASQGLFEKYASELRKLNDKYPDRVYIQFEWKDMLEPYVPKSPHEVKDADKENRHRNNIEYLQTFVRDHLLVDTESNHGVCLAKERSQWHFSSNTTAQANSHSDNNFLGDLDDFQHFWAPEAVLHEPGLHGNASDHMNGYPTHNVFGGHGNVEHFWEPENGTSMNRPGLHSGAPVQVNNSYFNQHSWEPENRIGMNDSGLHNSAPNQANSYSDQNSLERPNNLEDLGSTFGNELPANSGNVLTPYYQHGRPLPTLDQSQGYNTGFTSISPPSSKDQLQSSLDTRCAAINQLQSSPISTVPLWGNNTQPAWYGDFGNLQDGSGTFGSSRLSAQGPTASYQSSYKFPNYIPGFPELSGYSMTEGRNSSTNRYNSANLGTGQTHQDFANDVWRVGPSVASFNRPLAPRIGNKRGREDDDEAERPGKKSSFPSSVPSIPQTGMLYPQTDGAQEVDLWTNMAPQHATQFPMPANPLLPMMSTPQDNYAINPVHHQHAMLQDILRDDRIDPSLAHPSS